MIEISFIIPVYNVQEYIYECIESLLKIKNIKYEILIIDDGSTDDSISAIGPLTKNPTLKIFHQENQGLSIARNVGIKNAKGKYISLIDGDDKINPLLFEQLYEKGKKANADIISGDFTYWKNGELIDSEKSLKKAYILSGKEILQNKYKLLTSITCRNLYKREFILTNNLYFVEGIFFEDVEWMPRAYYLAKRIAYYNIPFYYYRQREASITKSVFSIKKFEDCLYIAHLHLELCKKIDSNLKHFFHRNAFYCIYKAITCYPHAEKENNNQFIQNLSPLISSEGNIKIKLFFFLYKSSPTLLLHVLHLLKK